ncbi:hypothetical protein [Shewanella livingstonensis]
MMQIIHGLHGINVVGIERGEVTPSMIVL